MYAFAKNKTFDRLFKVFLVLPLVCYWRGIWDLLTYYFSDLPKPLNGWAIYAVGSAFVLAYFIYPFANSKSEKLSFKKRAVVTRCTLYICSFCLMAYWRGLWELLDYYLQGYGVACPLIVSAVSYTTLLLLKASKTIMFPPFIVCVDNRPDSLVPSTWFQITLEKNAKSVFLYTLDSFFTHFVVLSLAISTWYGSLTFLLVIQPHTVQTYLAYYIIGLAMCLVIFAMEIPLQMLASKLFRVEIVSAYFENCTHAIFACSTESFSQNDEKTDVSFNESKSNLSIVKETEGNYFLRNQLLPKVIKMKTSNDKTHNMADKQNFQLSHNNLNCIKNNNFNNSNIDISSKISFSELDFKKFSQNISQNSLQMSLHKTYSLSHLATLKIKRSEKLAILIYENFVGLFVFISLSFIWLGLWELNIFLFKFGEPWDAWINFLCGSFFELAVGLVSFSGVCGCGHDMPIVTSPTTLSKSVSSE